MEPTQPIITKLMVPKAVSSYKTEIIANQAGLEAAKMNPRTVVQYICSQIRYHAFSNLHVYLTNTNSQMP